MKNFKLKLFYLFFFFLLFFIFKIFSKPINFDGLKKLNLEDIQALTNLDIFSNDFDKIKINSLIKELYNSDLIYDLKLSETSESYLISIEENYKIENIYINGNIKFDDEILKNIISSNVKSFINKELISNDIDTIRNFYSSQGFMTLQLMLLLKRLA